MAASLTKVALAVVYKDNGKTATKLIASFNGTKDATRFVSEITERLKGSDDKAILAVFPDFPKDPAGRVRADVKFRAAEVPYNPSFAMAEVSEDVLSFDL